MLGSMRERVVAVGVLLPALLLGLVGCGSASAPSPPTGIDQLTVPTPSPDPDDFTARVDNPWFPLAPGTTWTYDVADPRGTHLLVVTVAAGPEVAGVATTARVADELGRSTTDWYAEDRSGNVWWLGREGVWRAGESGAEAGLAMPAHPRIGDGFRPAYAAGVSEDVAKVAALDGRVTVPAGQYADTLELDRRSGLTDASVTQLYAHGVGLVEESTVDADYRTVRLRAVTTD